MPDSRICGNDAGLGKAHEPEKTPFVETAHGILFQAIALGDRAMPVSRFRNGGVMFIEAGDDIWQLFSVFDTSDRKTASRSATNIVSETKYAHKRTGFPSNAVAIANNGTGDLLILLPDSSGKLGPEVYLWLHDSDKAPEQLTASIDGRQV